MMISTIPGVGQLVGTTGYIGGAGGGLVDGEYQGSDGVAPSGIGRGKGVCASCVVVSSVPGVGQLVGAPGNIGGAGGGLVDGEYQGSYGVTASGVGRRVSISS